MLHQARPSLDNDRTWRFALVALFLASLLARLIVESQLASHPVGAMEEWFGSEPWFHVEKARSAVSGPDWLLRDGAVPNFPITQAMLELAPREQWHRLGDDRMPRGALVIYLMAASISLSGSLALYKLLALFASAIAPVLAACAAARLFRSRGVGILSGIAVAWNGSLLLAALLPGSWYWEAFALLAILAAAQRVREENCAPSALLAGLAIALSIWLRPFFWWFALLAPLALLRGVPERRIARLAALLVPVAGSALLLMARNHAADSSSAPTLAQPAWDFLSTTNERATLRAELPRDILVLEAARGRFARTLQLALSTPETRGALSPVLTRKLRETFGARDVAVAYSNDYFRRRFESLRLLSLAPDAIMAAGLASLLYLLLWARLPRTIAATLALLTLHAVLFRTSGADRLMLLVVFSMLPAAALVAAWRVRESNPARPFLLIALWAISHVALQIDDQARGSRFREDEFAVSARLLRNRGQTNAAEAERTDFRAIRDSELVLKEFWRADR